MIASEAIETFIDASIVAGWKIVIRDNARKLALPADIGARYGPLPASYEAFIRSVAIAANADESVWFVCERELQADWRNERDPNFAWNAFERMALESASNADEGQRIISFWDRHLPIMMAPNGDYDYVAIVVTGARQGSVVHGSAPEWEDASPVADSFEAWLAMLAQALREPVSVGGPLALQVMSHRRHGA